MSNIVENHAPIGWRFWLQWVLAGGVGMMVGFIGSYFLGDTLAQAMSGRTLDEVMSGEGPAFLLILTSLFTVSGIIIGLMQWLVVKPHLALSGGIRWVLATAVGFAIVVLLYFALPERVSVVVSEVVHNAIAGAVLGFIQLTILHQRVANAHWWVLTSALGMIIAGLVSYLLGGGPMNMVVGITAMAAFTGAVLVWLLRPTVTHSQLQPEQS